MAHLTQPIMTTKSRLALLYALVATPGFAAPFLAIGDNAELFLTARAEARFEDNVTFSPDFASYKSSDEVFEFVPGAELVFGKNSLTSGSLSVAERFVAYSENTGFNDELLNANFNSKFEGAKLQLNTRASFDEKMQSSREFSGTPRLVRRDVTSLGAGGELAVTAKSKVGLGVGYGKTDFKTLGFVDSTSYSVPLNYYFAITPRVDISAGIQYDATDVKIANQDSDSLFYNVGVRGELTPKLSGNVRVGLTTRDPDVGKSTDMVGLDAGLTYEYSPKTQFSLDLSQDYQSSAIGDGVENSSVNLRARSFISGGLTVNASIGYEMIDYLAATPRSDDYLTLGLGISYAVSRNLSVEANYNFLSNSSTNLGAEFDANIFGLAANFRY